MSDAPKWLSATYLLSTLWKLWFTTYNITSNKGRKKSQNLWWKIVVYFFSFGNARWKKLSDLLAESIENCVTNRCITVHRVGEGRIQSFHSSVLVSEFDKFLGEFGKKSPWKMGWVISAVKFLDENITESIQTTSRIFRPKKVWKWVKWSKMFPWSSAAQKCMASLEYIYAPFSCSLSNKVLFLPVNRESVQVFSNNDGNKIWRSHPHSICRLFLHFHPSPSSFSLSIVLFSLNDSDWYVRSLYGCLQ